MDQVKLKKKYERFNFDNFYNKRFNKLLILSYEGMNKKSSRMVNVLCDCGKEKIMELDKVKSGRSKSCGCVSIQKTKDNAKHGMWEHPIYRVWIGMKARCYNKKIRNYHLYGGYGVIVCDLWVNNFNAFYEWAKDKWQPGLQLDKDIKYMLEFGTDRGMLYSPEYCQFVTAKENVRAQMSVQKYTIDGITKPIIEWCEVFNIKMNTVYSRIHNQKLDVLTALTKKIGVGGGGKHYKINPTKIELIKSMRAAGKKLKEICFICEVVEPTVRGVLRNSKIYDENFYKRFQ